MLEHEVRARKEAKDLAEKMTSFVNSSSTRKKVLFEELDREHRFLQAEVFDMCIKYIQHVANDNYQHDGRNEWCHKFAKQLIEKAPELF